MITIGTAIVNSITVSGTGINNGYLGQVDVFGLENQSNPFLNGLLASYQFENNSDDITGQYNGLNEGVTFSSGLVNTHGVFNGLSKIFIPDELEIPLEGSFAITFLINREVSGENLSLFSVGNNSSNWGMFIRSTTEGRILFRCVFGNNAISVETGILENQNNYHVSCIVDRQLGIMKILVNGMLVDSKNISGTIRGANQGKFIGCENITGEPRFFWKGLIDEVKFYERALSDTEINIMATQELLGNSVL